MVEREAAPVRDLGSLDADSVALLLERRGLVRAEGPGAEVRDGVERKAGEEACEHVREKRSPVLHRHPHRMNGAYRGGSLLLRAGILASRLGRNILPTGFEPVLPP